MLTSGISAILHGDSKAGKSTAANTVPAPRLLVDAEAAHRWLPGKKVFWDPITQAPPAAPTDGEWETCVVIVRSWATFVRAYEWLNSGEHPFESVFIDSVTEIQVKMKEEITHGDVETKLNYDGWNTMLVRMEDYLRRFRDLTVHPTHPLKAVVLTAMTTFKDGKWRPYIQGQAAGKLPYFFDLIGYVYRENIVDPMNPGVPPRTAHRVLTGFDPNIVSGERIGGLIPPIVDDLNFDSILRQAFPDTYATINETPTGN